MRRVVGIALAGLLGIAGTSRAQAPVDTCPAAPTVTAFPYVLNAQSTSDAADNYNLATSGICAGGGTQVAGTGSGADEVVHFRVWKSCTLSINLFPNGGVNLALYAVRDCGALASSCLRVSDAGAAGTGEVLNVTVSPLVDYWVLIDGSGGSSGGYGFNIGENPSGQDCVGLFADGFERGTFDNWSSHT
jgi:hypothetical protein